MHPGDGLVAGLSVGIQGLLGRSYPGRMDLDFHFVRVKAPAPGHDGPRMS